MEDPDLKSKPHGPWWQNNSGRAASNSRSALFRGLGAANLWSSAWGRGEFHPLSAPPGPFKGLGIRKPFPCL